jgi:glucosamine--fructose-6-phosphate aminotransferase (isomerizing)
MCGIVGYIGAREAYPIIINGLKRLEYRGYDSAGVCLSNGDLRVFRKKGKVVDLVELVGAQETHATAGMGHTRWATHGEPSDRNSHPHSSADGDLVLVHNGIIENYAALKSLLQAKGYSFSSDTDTEVLVNFIHYVQKMDGIKLEEAVGKALREVVGAYAIVVMSRKEANKLVVRPG